MPSDQSLSGLRTPELACDGPEPMLLAAVGQQLRDRGCTVQLADVGSPGEIDIRLITHRGGSPVSVELLGPCECAGQAGPRDCWCAVRVGAGEARCVWVGPARPCPAEALVAFVDDLFGDDLALLRNRYVAVG